MNAGLKYGLARIGLFVAVSVPLALAFPRLNLLIVLMFGLLVSALLSFVLPPLRGWRDEIAGTIAVKAAHRSVEKERLRAALAGEDESPAHEELRGPSGRVRKPAPDDES